MTNPSDARSPPRACLGEARVWGGKVSSKDDGNLEVNGSRAVCKHGVTSSKRDRASTRNDTQKSDGGWRVQRRWDVALSPNQTCDDDRTEKMGPGIRVPEGCATVDRDGHSMCQTNKVDG